MKPRKQIMSSRKSYAVGRQLKTKHESLSLGGIRQDSEDHYEDQWKFQKSDTYRNYADSWGAGNLRKGLYLWRSPGSPSNLGAKEGRSQSAVG